MSRAKKTTPKKIKAKRVAAKLVKKPRKAAAKKKKILVKRTLAPVKKFLPPRNIPIDQLEIPAQYPGSWIGLMAKDPLWIFVTWEIAYPDLKRARAALHDVNREAKIVLRMYDVSLLDASTWLELPQRPSLSINPERSRRVDFNGRNAHHWFDLEVGSASSWYINLWSDQVSYCAEIGLRTASGNFFPMARSNAVQTPRAGFSFRNEQIWMEVRDAGDSSVYIESYPEQSTGEGRYPKSKRIDLGPEDIRRYYDALMPRLRDLLRGRLKRRYRLSGEGFDDQDFFSKLLPAGKFVKRILIGSSNVLVELMDLENLPSSAAFIETAKTGPLIPIQDIELE